MNAPNTTPKLIQFLDQDGSTIHIFVICYNDDLTSLSIPSPIQIHLSCNVKKGDVIACDNDGNTSVIDFTAIPNLGTMTFYVSTDDFSSGSSAFMFPAIGISSNYQMTPEEVSLVNDDQNSPTQYNLIVAEKAQPIYDQLQSQMMKIFTDSQNQVTAPSLRQPTDSSSLIK